jgi:hypothetical protein
MTERKNPHAAATQLPPCRTGQDGKEAQRGKSPGITTHAPTEEGGEEEGSPPHALPRDATRGAAQTAAHSVTHTYTPTPPPLFTPAARRPLARLALRGRSLGKAPPHLSPIYSIAGAVREQRSEGGAKKMRWGLDLGDGEEMGLAEVCMTVNRAGRGSRWTRAG